MKKKEVKEHQTDGDGEVFAGVIQRAQLWHLYLKSRLDVLVGMCTCGAERSHQRSPQSLCLLEKSFLFLATRSRHSIHVCSRLY